MLPDPDTLELYIAIPGCSSKCPFGATIPPTLTPSPHHPVPPPQSAPHPVPPDGVDGVQVVPLQHWSHIPKSF